MTLKPETRAFINAVVSPFEADLPARVPDLESLQSVCFRDAVEITPINNFWDGVSPGVAINGVLLFSSYGWTQMKNTFCDGTSDNSVYHSGMIGFDTNGNPLFLNTTNFYFSFLTQNYDVIFGNGGGGLPVAGTALVQAHRVISHGLRVLPAIEMVTDTTIPYVSYYISGQPTATELQQWMNGSLVDIRTLVKNSPYADVFGNSDGTCNRYDPAQKNNLFQTIQLDNWANQAMRKDDVRMPAIAIQFSQPIAFNDALPIIIHSQWWLECELRQPTPIATSPSPVDPAFDHVMYVLSTSDEIYPIVTKGHSFKTFSSRLNSFLKQANETLYSSSSLVGNLTRLGVGVSRIVNARRRRRRKRKRARRRARGPVPRRGNRNAVPIGRSNRVRNS